MLFLIATAGCAEHSPESADTPLEVGQFAPLPNESDENSPPRPVSADNGPRFSRQMGTGVFLNPNVARAPVASELLIHPTDDGEYSVNLINVPIVQASEAILGDTLKLNFAVAPGLEGVITVLTSRPLSGGDLLETFRAALELNNLELTLSEGMYLVQRRALTFPRVREFPAAGTAENTIYALPLRFISANEMMRILQSIASPSVKIQAVSDRNILLVTGSIADIEGVVDAVNLFDIDLLQGKSVSLVTLLTIDPVAVAEELDLVFESYDGGPLDDVITFVPNNELNSILIITTQPLYLAQAEAWIRRYETSVSREMHTAAVYRLENRTAMGLAPRLEKLLSYGTLSLQEGNDPLDPAAVEDLTVVGDPFVADSSGSQEIARIVADDVSNTIMVYATPSEHVQIARLIKRLDRVANQVLIEATIAEVKLTDELEFGVRWFLESGNFGFNFTGIAAATTVPAAVIPGFNATFSSGSGTRVALNALASVTDVNIISSPSLLVLDNHEALLNVGDRVPIVTRTAVSVEDPAAPVVNSITQQDTGVILRIIPRVSLSGRIILDIQQEVSNAVATVTSGIDSPTIQQRIIHTTVAVDDGESIVLGGLIRSGHTKTRTKVPLLGDIPVLGALFRNTSEVEERFELLIFITPRVIRDPMASRKITDEFRNRLSGAVGVAHPPDLSAPHQIRRIFY